MAAHLAVGLPSKVIAHAPSGESSMCAVADGLIDRHAALRAAVAAAEGPRLLKAQKELKATGRKRKPRPGGQGTATPAKRGSGQSIWGANVQEDVGGLMKARASDGPCCAPPAAMAGEGELVVKILKHHVYGGATAGSLYNVYVRVLYKDGRRSSGFIPAEALAGSEVLEAYTRTLRGRNILKFCKFSGP